MKTPAFDNNSRTEHGSAIADQIQGEDAYGYSGNLTASDLWGILDQFETHLMDTPKDIQTGEILNGRALLEFKVTIWKQELEAVFPDMETVI